ncbi:MAG: hypothetical protein LBP63_00710 [Prevotellaceae bacterium]|jgi:hypothetical protein|nr:hypothetical protein [Prevotellaceae bacterium]
MKNIIITLDCFADARNDDQMGQNVIARSEATKQSRTVNSKQITVNCQLNNN